jgi:hypothetical protein
MNWFTGTKPSRMGRPTRSHQHPQMWLRQAGHRTQHLPQPRLPSTRVPSTGAGPLSVSKALGSPIEDSFGRVANHVTNGDVGSSGHVSFRLVLQTYRLDHRVGLAVHKRLGELGGTGIMLAAGAVDHEGRLIRRHDEVVEALDDKGQVVRHFPLQGAQLAVSLAEAGWLATAAAVSVACDPTTGGRARKERRVWKAVTPDAGAAAAIFMAHGLGETISVASPERCEHQQRARQLLREHLPWTDDDEAEVAAAVQRAAPPTDSSNEAEYDVIWRALLRLIGEEAARRLPGVSSIPQLPNLRGTLSKQHHAAGVGEFSPETYTSGLAWRILLGHYKAPFLALSDPELLDNLERRTTVPPSADPDNSGTRS